MGKSDSELTGPIDGGVEPELVARRAMLKKAAVGAAAVGALWVAPKVEGLSIVPDASAATGPNGTFTGSTSVKFTYVPNPLSANDYWGGHPAPFFGWTNAATTKTVSLAPVTPGHPGGGSMTFTVPAGTKADSSGSVPVDISFSGASALTKICGATFSGTGRTTAAGNFPIAVRPLPSVGFPALPRAANAGSLTYTIPQALNDYPPPAPIGANGQWNDFTLTFNFC